MNEFDVDYEMISSVEKPEAGQSAETVDFGDAVFETNASLKTQPLSMMGEALQETTVDGFPFHLCDEELLGELARIPDRLAFKIGDVADLAQVKAYVLRYWETEFDILHPKKSKNNQRMYARRDVENVLLIKKLLYRDRFSIEGARSALKQLKTQVKKERRVIENQNRYRDGVQKLHEMIEDIQSLRRAICRI